MKFQRVFRIYIKIKGISCVNYLKSDITYPESDNIIFNIILSLSFQVFTVNELTPLINSEIQCRIHESSPWIPIYSQLDPVYTLDSYFCKIHLNNRCPSSILRHLKNSCFEKELFNI